MKKRMNYDGTYKKYYNEINLPLYIFMNYIVNCLKFERVFSAFFEKTARPARKKDIDYVEVSSDSPYCFRVMEQSRLTPHLILLLFRRCLLPLR
jgi:hypothetical protein